jgi:hypothetical protein
MLRRVFTYEKNGKRRKPIDMYQLEGKKRTDMVLLC